MIHVGHFQQNPHEIIVEAYGRDNPIDRRVFPLRDYGRPVPEFIDRFASAYKAELAYFAAHIGKNEPFCVNQNDGLRAMEVIEAGTKSLRGRQSAQAVEYA